MYVYLRSPPPPARRRYVDQAAGLTTQVDENGMANILQGTRAEARQALRFLRDRGLMASICGKEVVESSVAISVAGGLLCNRVLLASFYGFVVGCPAVFVVGCCRPFGGLFSSPPCAFDAPVRLRVSPACTYRES